MPSLPTGTVTFLFTDIEGSTTLLQRLGDRRYAEVLAEHQRLLRDAFAEGNGQEVDTQGDAFLVAFSRARDAVATAVAAQRALTKHAWPDGTSLRVRMALHTGEPVSETGGYVGLDVHRAARMCSAGHGGQILVSQAVEVLAAPDLPPGASLRDLGTHRLKDLKDPEHLFQVVHPDLRMDFPPPKSLDAVPNNLPRQLTSFIGREREMAEVKRLLSTAYLVTLTGPGGAGKTRLALQVGTDLLDKYPDGVWFVELAPLSGPALVAKAVASALGVLEQPGRSLTETLADSLRGKSVPVILDTVSTWWRTRSDKFVHEQADGQAVMCGYSHERPWFMAHEGGRALKPDAKTESEVLATLDEFSGAFARRTQERVMALFATDADIVFIGSEAGETAIGPNALEIRLKAIFSRPESYSWEWKWRSVSAAESVAWVTADAVVRAKGGERDLALPYRLTVVMEKRHDRWLWMQYHGSEPAGRRAHRVTT